MSDHVTHVTDATFATDVQASETLTIVDFWATWCGPCRALSPVLEQVAAAHEGAVKVAKINADENIQTTTRYNVRSLPTLLFFKGGEVVGQLIGAVPRARIEAVLTQHM